jgi:serine/threonine protein kinase
MVGQTLGGKYAIERVVAETELSVVYRATHRIWRRPVAIKVFKAPMLAENARDRLLESFVNEGALMMDLSERCSAICQARDVGSTVTASGDWVPYTVLEWLEGESLDASLARSRHRRTVKEAVELLEPVATALTLAHERGIVHLDVKPGNVFLLTEAAGENARCKLLDFGIAKVVDLTNARMSLDGSGQRSFTPAYGAPEQFSTAYGTTGAWTDVFALALVFVELVVGREALGGGTIEVLAIQSCDALRRPTPRALGADVSDDVERVLARALAARPGDRYPNAGDFWFALGHAARKRAGAEANPLSRSTPVVVPREQVPLAPAIPVERSLPIALRRRRRSLPPGPAVGAARPARGLRWIVPAVAILGAVTGLAALQRLSSAAPSTAPGITATAAQTWRASFGETRSAKPHPFE